MQFPLSFSDISLWLAATAIILITTAEITSARYGQTNLIVEKKRLKAVALTLSVLFICTFLIRIYLIIVL